MQLFTFILLVMIPPVMPDLQEHCPKNVLDNYNHYYLKTWGTKCYRFVTSKVMEYANAAKECRSDGGYLAMPKSLGENYFLSFYLRDTYNTFNNVWIGLKDPYTEGSFYWEDGTKLHSDDFSNFEEEGFWGELKDRAKDCVSLHPTSGKWDEEHCHENVLNIFSLSNTYKRFVCQYKVYHVYRDNDESPTSVAGDAQSTTHPPLSTTHNDVLQTYRSTFNAVDAKSTTQSPLTTTNSVVSQSDVSTVVAVDAQSTTQFPLTTTNNVLSEPNSYNTVVVEDVQSTSQRPIPTTRSVVSEPDRNKDGVNPIQSGGSHNNAFTKPTPTLPFSPTQMNSHNYTSTLSPDLVHTLSLNDSSSVSTNRTPTPTLSMKNTSLISGNQTRTISPHNRPFNFTNTTPILPHIDTTNIISNVSSRNDVHNDTNVDSKKNVTNQTNVISENDVNSGNKNAKKNVNYGININSENDVYNGTDIDSKNYVNNVANIASNNDMNIDEFDGDNAFVEDLTDIKHVKDECPDFYCPYVACGMRGYQKNGMGCQICKCNGDE